MIEYNVKVSRQFKWVLDWLEKWRDENKTGEIRVIHKDGGIAGMNRDEYEKVPRSEH